MRELLLQFPDLFGQLVNLGLNVVPVYSSLGAVEVIDEAFHFVGGFVAVSVEVVDPGVLLSVLID